MFFLPADGWLIAREIECRLLICPCGGSFQIRFKVAAISAYTTDGVAMQGAGLWWVLALLLVPSGLGIYYYNRLVFNRARVAEAWSGIDVQLKRRSSLIPALVECVRQYMKHEQGTLQALVQERLRAVQLADAPLGQRAPVEAHLGTQLHQLLALVEDYPTLKADGQFLDLQRNLTDVENHIQMARRYYNGAVRELNVLVESVPSNLVARLFAFTRAEYFSLDDPRDAQSPKMEF
jgi:LemA protein